MLVRYGEFKIAQDSRPVEEQSGLRSTKQQKEAPRLNASSPTDPDPQNVSSTLVVFAVKISMNPNVLNKASLTFAIIGRKYTEGESIFFPFATPPIMRNLLGLIRSCTRLDPWFKIFFVPDPPESMGRLAFTAIVGTPSAFFSIGTFTIRGLWTGSVISFIASDILGSGRVFLGGALLIWLVYAFKSWRLGTPAKASDFFSAAFIRKLPTSFQSIKRRITLMR
jgi:hypothetical protein